MIQQVRDGVRSFAAAISGSHSVPRHIVGAAGPTRSMEISTRGLPSERRCGVWAVSMPTELNWAPIYLAGVRE